MPRLETRDYTYFTTVRGMCRQCRSVTPARVFFRDGRVWQESLCPSCRNEPALIASDVDWYLEHTLRTAPDHSPIMGAHPPKNGCPLDCGPCAWHAAACQLPIFSITNACNLNCPICFTYNRGDRPWHMSIEEIRETLDWIIQSSGAVDLVNLTGGEPTLHPHLTDLIKECRRPEIGRITMNSNGLRLAEDFSLCQQLAELDVCVVLSLSTLDPAVSRKLHGADVVDAKLKAIANLTRAGARIALLNVLIHGVNEDVPGTILGMMQENNAILSLTVQTMTYTGQGGGSFEERRHIPVDEAVDIICKHSGGSLTAADFAPRPSAHPLCYAVSYLLKSEGHLLPFSRFVPWERLSHLMSDSYLLRIRDDRSFFQDVVNDLYAAGDSEVLKVFRELTERVYPRTGPVSDFERQRLAEESVRTVYVHAHMDEDNFDCSRAMLCPDLVPAEPGRLVPACTYNLFYRMQDERFYPGSEGDS